MSVSVAFDGGRSGIRLARAGTRREPVRSHGRRRGEELILGRVGDVVAEGFGEELIGGGEVLLAVAEQHAGPVVEGGPSRLGHQRGLARSGLARDEQDLASFATSDTLGRIGHACISVSRPTTHAADARPGGRGAG